MKKLFTFFLLAGLAFSMQAQDITNKLSATGNFKVDKNDGTTNLFTLSETGDHLMQLSANTKAFTINNSNGEAIFELDDAYDFADLAKLKIGHADEDWLGSSNFSNLQLQSTFETKLHLVHIGNTFNLISGYKATGSFGAETVLGDNSGMLGMYAYGYDGSDYDYAGGILISTDGTYTSQIPSKIKFLTATNSEAPAVKMIIKNDGKVGVGTETPTSTLDVNGSVGHAVAGGGTDITLDDTHYFYRTYNGSGNITVTLPDVTTCSGRVYIVKHTGGGTSTSTVAAASGQKIDGLDNYVLSTIWEYVTVISDGIAWSIIGQN